MLAVAAGCLAGSLLLMQQWTLQQLQLSTVIGDTWSLSSTVISLSTFLVLDMVMLAVPGGGWKHLSGANTPGAFPAITSNR